MGNCDRRNALKFLGYGVSAAGISGLMFSRKTTARQNANSEHKYPIDDKPIETKLSPDEAWKLVRPLHKGSRIGHCRVRDATVQKNIVVVQATLESGRDFEIKICRRDRSAEAPRPVSCNTHFDFFIANGGDGSKITEESAGTAVMQMATLVESQNRTDTVKLDTLREHWQNS